MEKAAGKKTTITAGQLADIAFILYFANTTVRWVLHRVMGTNVLSNAVAVLLPYAFLLLCCFIDARKYLIPDFILMYVGILVFFGITLWIHPEYAYYYSREEYGVWDHVLIPYRGIYAYLFIRIMDDPKRVIRNLKIAGVILFPYFLYQIRTASERGYWMGVGQSGAVEMSYSVSFGYNVLPYALVFLWSALEERRAVDIMGAVIGIVMILTAGSRGPVIFIGETIILYVLLRLKNARQKVLILISVLLVTVLLYYYYNTILMGISALLTQSGMSSRFISKLLEGTITTDSGRGDIWQAAWQMIKDNPLGYGAMGSRRVITSYIYAGYPHSVILEFLIDYGVLIGGILLIAMGVFSYKYIFRHDDDWKVVFLPFFCAACCLFLSMTYWSIPAFWAALGAGVNYSISLWNKKHAKGTEE